MDEFDAVDIVYDAVSAADIDIMIYKDKSEVRCARNVSNGSSRGT